MDFKIIEGKFLINDKTKGVSGQLDISSDGNIKFSFMSDRPVIHPAGVAVMLIKDFFDKAILVDNGNTESNDSNN